MDSVLTRSDEYQGSRRTKLKDTDNHMGSHGTSTSKATKQNNLLKTEPGNKLAAYSFISNRHNNTDIMPEQHKTTSLHACLPDSKGSMRSLNGGSSLTSTSLSMPKTQSLHESFMQERRVEMTPARRAKVAEFENSTIQKQRNELQLLIAELKGRDKELNGMVTAHQKQLVSWERDRKKIISLEEKCSVLEKEILHKKDEIRTLNGQIRVLQSTDVNKTTALNHAQDQLASVTEDHTHIALQMHDLKQQVREATEHHSLASMEITDLEEKNRNLTNTIMELNSTIGQFDAREQELITVLKLKDKDMSESATRISELSAKGKKMENVNEQSKRVESDMKRSANEWKNKYNQIWKEYDYLKREYRKCEQENDACLTELNRTKQELSSTRKEAILATERDKRKEQLLELQQSKQDRSEMELANMRELYERQQRDLAVLHLNLENTKEIVDKQQVRLLHQRKMELDAESIRTKPLSYGEGSSAHNFSRISTRSPTRTNTRTPTIAPSRSSPHRIANRTRSPDIYRSASPTLKRSYSPSSSGRLQQRSRSPNTLTSRIRTRSPSPRTSTAHRSPVRYSSPGRSSYIPSYRDEIESEEASDINRSYSYERISAGPYLESSLGRHYSKSYSYKSDDVDTKEKDDHSPYASYSAGDYGVYRPGNWSSTSALAKSAEEIINKYYPLSEQVNKDSKTPSMPKGDGALDVNNKDSNNISDNVAVLPEMSGGNDLGSNSGLPGGETDNVDGRGSEKSSHKSDDSVKQRAQHIPAIIRDQTRDGSDVEDDLLYIRQDDQANTETKHIHLNSQDLENNSQHSSDGFQFDFNGKSGTQLQDIEREANMIASEIVGAASLPHDQELGPIINRDDQSSAATSPRVYKSGDESVTGESVHSSVKGAGAAGDSVHTAMLHTGGLDSPRAESIHSGKEGSVHSSSSRRGAESVHSFNEDNLHSLKADSVHSSRAGSVHSFKVDSVHSFKEDSVHSSKAESVHSVKADSVHSFKADSVHSSRPESVNSFKEESVHSTHSSRHGSVHSPRDDESLHSRAESRHSMKADSIHSDINAGSVHSAKQGSVHSTHSSVARSNHTAQNEHLKSELMNGDMEKDDEVDDLFSIQTNTFYQQPRPDSTTPTNDIPAKDLLAENDSSTNAFDVDEMLE